MARMLLATLMTVGVIMTIGFLFAGGSGVSQATPGSHGDLLLDWAVGDNTDVAVGTIDSGCQLFAAGTVVRIDVIAVDAIDWADMDFVFSYPVGAGSTGLTRPGPGDADVDQFFDAAAGFDFVPLDPGTGANGGPQNFMTTGAGSSLDYSVTDRVPDGSSNPHGISLEDIALVGESGDGGIARISLDTTGLPAGVYTLSLGITSEFAGGVHSDASPFRPDNAPTGDLPVTFASAQIGIGSCAPTPSPAPTPGPAGTPTPTPGPGTAAPTSGPGTATPTPTATTPFPPVGGAPGDGGGGNSWPIVAIVVGGVLLGVAATGAIAQRLRQRISKTQ